MKTAHFARARVAALAALAIAAVALPGLVARAQIGPADAAADPVPASTTATTTPNIVLLVMDDLDLSVWQNAIDRGYLPRIKADVIDKGTTFDQTFVAESLCCPSRTTMLTGQYPHNHGVIDNFGDHGGFLHFDRDGSTIATWMQAAGYRTGLVGKYLNGYGRSSKDQHGAYIAPGWEFWRALTSHKQYDYDISVQGVMVHHGSAPEDYQEDVLRGMALEFLASTDPRPFFLVLTPTAPHYESSEKSDDDGVYVRPAPRYEDTPRLETIPPETLPSFNEADMSDKPRFMRALATVSPATERNGYNSEVASIRAVDDMLGAVVDSLKRTLRLSNTLIIVTSDNGFQFGTHRRRGKTDLYEESIRVPMVIRAPGQWAPRHVSDWVMNIDWAPTVADFGGAVPDIVVDGISLGPWVRGGSGSARQALLVEQPSAYAFATHPPQREVRSHEPAVTGDPTGATTLVYAQTLNRSNVVTNVEFYDLSVDPYQLQSLHASTDPKRVQQMKTLKARLAALQACVGTVCLSQ